MEFPYFSFIFYFIAVTSKEIEFVRFGSHQQRTTAISPPPSGFAHAQFASSTDKVEKDVESTLEVTRLVSHSFWSP